MSQMASQMAADVQNSYEQQIWNQMAGMAAQQQAGQGKVVTPEDKQRMALRRCGNICLEARDRGWTVRIETGEQYRAWFLSREGKRVCGRGHSTKAGALYNATEQLETLGFLKD